MTLAYVFWHCRKHEVCEEEYEASLTSFHRELNINVPDGFLGSLVFQLGSAPWLPTEFSLYEDWYMLEDSAVIDKLNDAAITGPLQAPHDQTARIALRQIVQIAQPSHIGRESRRTKATRPSYRASRTQYLNMRSGIGK